MCRGSVYCPAIEAVFVYRQCLLSSGRGSVCVEAVFTVQRQRQCLCRGSVYCPAVEAVFVYRQCLLSSGRGSVCVEAVFTVQR